MTTKEKLLQFAEETEEDTTFVIVSKNTKGIGVSANMTLEELIVASAILQQKVSLEMSKAFKGKK